MQRYILLLLLALAMACQPLKTDEKINAKEVNQEIKDRKIKRIFDDDIVSFAFERGQALASVWEQRLPADSALCGGQSLLPTQEKSVLAAVYVRCLGQAASHHTKEQEVWDAYQTAWKDGNMPQASIQRLGTKETYTQLLYAHPVQIKRNGQAEWAMLSLILEKKEVVRLM